MNHWVLPGAKAFITGATKGIGRAVAEEMLRLGASVWIVARDAAMVQTTCDTWREAGYNVHGSIADISESGERLRLMAEIQDVWGNLDILVNNKHY